MNNAGFDLPPEHRYFEDYVAGNKYRLGEAEVHEQEIIEFARRYDPQPMHTDPEAAARGIYGGLIASGWHTGALMMRLLVEKFLPGQASVGSPGIDRLRWLRPVRPGDVLSVTTTVLEARRSASRPEMGLIRTETVVANQREEQVLTVEAVNFILCRTRTD